MQIQAKVSVAVRRSTNDSVISASTRIHELHHCTHDDIPGQRDYQTRPRINTL